MSAVYQARKKEPGASFDRFNGLKRNQDLSGSWIDSSLSKKSESNHYGNKTFHKNNSSSALTHKDTAPAQSGQFQSVTTAIEQY